MPLGTLDRTPPPFFRQGPSALTKLVFCAALALFLMVADTRLKLTGPLRTALAVALLPVQRALAVPIEIAQGGGDYLGGLKRARAREAAAEQRLAQQADRLLRAEQLAQENARLRALLDLRPAQSGRSQPAEVLYEAADPFSRKVYIDRGSAQGVQLGSPVIHEAGVLGQVTRVYPLTAEVTLLSDKDAAIPVLNTRTQQRSVAFGGVNAGMELRFTSANADVQAGDVLQTSGLDGIYPPGLPVAKVTAVERRVESGFARISLQPLASADGVRHLLVLEPRSAVLPPRPELEAAPTTKGKGKSSPAGPGRKSSDAGDAR